MQLNKKDYIKMGLDSQYCGDYQTFHQEQMENDPDYRNEYERLELQRSVALIIARKRQERHLSQQELAQRAKTTQSVISRIENGNVSVGIQMLQRIAQALDSKVEIMLQ